MSDLVKSGDGNIITLLHRGQQPVNPFPKPIFLFSSHIARTTYIDNIDELAPCLVEDKGLSLFREPQKPHDEKAVAVYDGADRIGYIPQDENEVISRLMDAGKQIYGIITGKEYMAAG